MKYWFSPKIKWSVFKKINDPYKGSIYPVNCDKILWRMLRDRSINIYFDNKSEDPVCITTQPIPKSAKIINNI